jgi:hypothetical protein
VATIKSVERQIRRVERFDVRFLHSSGGDVRGDMQGIPGYACRRAMKDDASVAQWRRRRFRRQYPGFGVVVLHANRTRAHGATLLGTLRREYS